MHFDSEYRPLPPSTISGCLPPAPGVGALGLRFSLPLSLEPVRVRGPGSAERGWKSSM
jgi:hypothetical protein